MRLANKVALITNVADLQGAPDAAEFQREGAILCIQATDISAARSELDRAGVDLEPRADSAGPIQLIEADFGEPGVADRHIDGIVEQHGRLDILVNNNAPAHIEKPLEQISDAEWRAMFHRIVDELFMTTRAALRHMLPARQGKILNIGSTGGIDPYRDGYYTAYCAARAAVLNLTKGLGREVAPHNVQVNAIAQNYVENPSYFPPEEVSSHEFQTWLKTAVPIQRLAQPWEQARLAAFLVSSDADFLCGTVIPFSGGDTL